MKIQIENSIILEDTDYLSLKKLCLFNRIIDDLIRIKTSEDVRIVLNSSCSLYSEFFEWGFGSNHFWLRDKSDKRLEKRVLFIDFLNQ
jgi:hypothetical protein